MKKTASPANDDRRLTYGEAATMLKVSTATICRYASRKLLDRVRVTSRNVFVTETSVRRLLQVQSTRE